MKALFEVTFGSVRAGRNFTAKTVLAKDAVDAIRKATVRVGAKIMSLEGGLRAEEVKLLGVED